MYVLDTCIKYAVAISDFGIQEVKVNILTSMGKKMW